MMTHQTNARPLRFALVANGVFSLLTGAVCIIAPSTLVSLLFTEPPTLFGLSTTTLITELGIGLLGFAALVLWTAGQATINRNRARLITALDVGWVLGSAGLLLAVMHIWTNAGLFTVVLVALVVCLFAVEQALGLMVIYQGRNEVEVERRGNQLTLTATGLTQASPERVWKVMSHQEAYADVADNISKVEVIRGSGADLERRCFDKDGKSWSETCSMWEEGRAFAFRVHTEAPDYPYPLDALSAEWSLAPDPVGTRIRMRFHVTAKPGLVNGVLFRLMAAPFSSICDRLLVRWIAIMEGTANPDHAELRMPGQRSAAQPA